MNASIHDVKEVKIVDYGEYTTITIVHQGYGIDGDDLFSWITQEDEIVLHGNDIKWRK